MTVTQPPAASSQGLGEVDDGGGDMTQHLALIRLSAPPVTHLQHPHLELMAGQLCPGLPPRKSTWSGLTTWAGPSVLHSVSVSKSCQKPSNPV